MDRVQSIDDIKELSKAANSYMLSSIAPSTSRQYTAHLQRYIQFCHSRNLSAFPLHQQNLVLFTTNLARSISYSSIKGQLAAKNFFSEVHGFNTTTTFTSFHRLYLTLRGIRRTQGNKHKKQKRLPITPDLLKIIQYNLHNSSLVYEDKLMLWAAMLTAFFGFLRISEYTATNKTLFDPELTLCYRDVKMLKYLQPKGVSRNGVTNVELNIKSSKTDPFRMGISVRLAANDSMLCPVQALIEYMAFHPKRQGPLFMFQNKKFLTRRDINNALKSYLNVNNVSSHSFRIGAATTAASAGYPKWLIQNLGRWTSDCFRTYIRITNSTIAKVCKSLVNTSAIYQIFDPDVI